MTGAVPLCGIDEHFHCRTPQVTDRLANGGQNRVQLLAQPVPVESDHLEILGYPHAPLGCCEIDTLGHAVRRAEDSIDVGVLLHQ